LFPALGPDGRFEAANRLIITPVKTLLAPLIFWHAISLQHTMGKHPLLLKRMNGIARVAFQHPEKQWSNLWEVQ
jgi:hypothetical protein